MEEEIWRPIRDHPGYEVSNMGQVRSIDRVITDSWGRSRKCKGRIVQPFTQDRGYQNVNLGRGFRSGVHVLVAEAFIAPRPEGQEVRHLNGNPRDNRVANLAYGTRSENMRDCYQYGRTYGKGKLLAEDVREIRKMISAGLKPKDIAAKFGVSVGRVSDIKTGRSFSYL